MSQGPETRLKLRFQAALRGIAGILMTKIQQVSVRDTADILLCVRGKYIAVELKSSHGKLSPGQKHFLNCVEAAGGVALVCYPDNLDEVVEFIKKRGGSMAPIQVTRETLRDHHFQRGLMKLRSFAGFKSLATTMAVARMLDKIEAEVKATIEHSNALMDKYAERDEKGQICQAHGPGTFAIPDEHHAAWDGEQKYFEAKVEAAKAPIWIGEIEGCPLSPAEVCALGALLTDERPGQTLRSV